LPLDEVVLSLPPRPQPQT